VTTNAVSKVAAVCVTNTRSAIPTNVDALYPFIVVGTGIGIDSRSCVVDVGVGVNIDDWRSCFHYSRSWSDGSRFYKEIVGVVSDI